MPAVAPHVPGRVDRSFVYLLAAGLGLVGLVVIATSPVVDLLGDSAVAIPAAVHGLFAALYILVGAITAYLSARLYLGRLPALRDLRLAAGIQALFALVTVVFGNWIFVSYRAPGGPRDFFIENQPAIHQIFFEFKESVSLFTVPLAVAAASILWMEGDAVAASPRRAKAVAILVVLAWLYGLLAFGLGASITKIRSV